MFFFANTGICFIAMSNRLATLTEKAGDQDSIWPNDKYLSPFLNKVNMMRIVDVPYLNLAGADSIPDRDHIFHVTFPTGELSSFDLTLISPGFLVDP